MQWSRTLSRYWSQGILMGRPPITRRYKCDIFLLPLCLSCVHVYRKDSTKIIYCYIGISPGRTMKNFAEFENWDGTELDFQHTEVSFAFHVYVPVLRLTNYILVWVYIIASGRKDWDCFRNTIFDYYRLHLQLWASAK